MEPHSDVCWPRTCSRSLLIMHVKLFQIQLFQLQKKKKKKDLRNNKKCLTPKQHIHVVYIKYGQPNQLKSALDFVWAK